MVTDCARCSFTIASMSSPLACASVGIPERYGTTTLSSRYFATQRSGNNTWRTQPVRQNALTKRFHFAHHLPPPAHTHAHTSTRARTLAPTEPAHVTTRPTVQLLPSAVGYGKEDSPSPLDTGKAGLPAAQHEEVRKRQRTRTCIRRTLHDYGSTLPRLGSACRGLACEGCVPCPPV